jgi:NTP pyrophosphatase (non-canonical NTP hydrolase)
VSTPLTLRQLQEEQKPWVAHNFPGGKPYRPLLGAVEEIGELCHAHLKDEQGIRGDADPVIRAAAYRRDKIDAIGDILIYLADYCTANGIDMQDALERTWTAVKQRDWVCFPKNGLTE